VIVINLLCTLLAVIPQCLSNVIDNICISYLCVVKLNVIGGGGGGGGGKKNIKKKIVFRGCGLKFFGGVFCYVFSKGGGGHPVVLQRGGNGGGGGGVTPPPALI